MEKKNIDWGNIGFGYVQTDYRYVSKFKDGAWDAGELTTDPNVTLNEWQTPQKDWKCQYSRKTASLMPSFRQ